MPAERSWRCNVCGYVHHGVAPPEACPVCGAAASEFEAIVEAGPAAAPPPQAQPLPAAQAAAAAKLKVVVIGAGIAGLSAAEAARQAAPEAHVTLLSKEDALPYYRLNLTRWLAGEVTDEELPIHPESWYAEQRVDLRRGAEAHTLDLAARSVHLRGGEELPFDRLVLAGGAHPFVPPFPGIQRQGVSALRTLADAQRLRAEARAGAPVVFIGGGILGLEAAAGLARQGAAVTILEGGPWLLPRQLNQRAAELLARYVQKAGVQLAANVKVSALLGDEGVRAVEGADGARFPADAVVITTGVRSSNFLAALAGLQVKQGVLVNDLLAASHPDVFAAGDVAEHRGVVYGIWRPAQYQGRIAGQNAVGAKLEFGGLPRSNTLKVLNVNLFSLGQTEPAGPHARMVDAEKDGTYAGFIFTGAKLTGAILLGDTSAAAGVTRAAEAGTNLAPVLHSNPSAAGLVSHFAGR